MQRVGQRGLVKTVQQPAQTLNLRQLGFARRSGGQFFHIHGLNEFGQNGHNCIQPAKVSRITNQIERSTLWRGYWQHTAMTFVGLERGQSKIEFSEESD